MIYTVTLNPCLDYVMELPHLTTGRVNRSMGEHFYVGGKGINVSLMLHRLGLNSTVLGIAGGFVGEQIASLLQQAGISTDFSWLSAGCSRINVKLSGAEETDLNAVGPAVEAETLAHLTKKIAALQEGDTLVLAGSVPTGVPEDIYRTLMRQVQGKGVRTVVDTTGAHLTEVLPLRPFLIKPNHHELGEIFGKELGETGEIKECAAALQSEGARNVLVSMAAKGALLLDEEGEVHHLPAPKGEVIAAVGAGDSMVAGFLAGFAQSGDYHRALQLGVACGSATAFSTRLGNKEQIDQLLEEM